MVLGAPDPCGDHAIQGFDGRTRLPYPSMIDADSGRRGRPEQDEAQAVLVNVVFGDLPGRAGVDHCPLRTPRTGHDTPPRPFWRRLVLRPALPHTYNLMVIP